MNVEYVRERLAELKRIGNKDFEKAHSLEDDLYAEFVRYVARHGSTELQNLAHEILRSKDINYRRVCA